MSRFSGPGPHADGWHDVTPRLRVKRQKRAEAEQRNAQTSVWCRRATREGPAETRHLMKERKSA